MYMHIHVHCGLLVNHLRSTAGALPSRDHRNTFIYLSVHVRQGINTQLHCVHPTSMYKSLIALYLKLFKICVVLYTMYMYKEYHKTHAQNGIPRLAIEPVKVNYSQLSFYRNSYLYMAHKVNIE